MIVNFQDELTAINFDKIEKYYVENDTIVVEIGNDRLFVAQFPDKDCAISAFRHINKKIQGSSYANYIPVSKKANQEY